MLFDINKSLCETYAGLDPIKLLDYPAEDVFNLINDTVSYNQRHKETDNKKNTGTIRRKAGDDWF